MDRTSDKQWLHDISHVGMRMGQTCQRERRNQGTESYYLSSPLTPREALYGGRCCEHLVCMRVVLTHL